jgi:hypothetical protein
MLSRQLLLIENRLNLGPIGSLPTASRIISVDNSAGRLTCLYISFINPRESDAYYFFAELVT